MKLSVTTLATLASLSLPLAAQCELDKITAADAAAGDAFGIAVGVDGDFALVGARGDDEHGPDAGAVYAFERTANAWVQTQKLAPEGLAAGDLFGASLAIAGDLAVIGAPRSDLYGPDEGAAYLFQRVGGAWQEVQPLLHADVGTADGDRFGTAVALSGTSLLVVAPRSDLGGGTVGAAYVFESSAGVWEPTARLDPGMTVGTLQACTLEGGTAVLSAPVFATPGGKGAAFVFEDRGPSWTLTATLLPDDGGVQFGASVALSEDRILVGAPSASGAQSNDGAAYVFVDGPSGWTQEAKLFDPEGNSFDGFGTSVALDDDFALIGAPRTVAPQIPEKAHVFQRQVSGWVSIAEMPALDSPESYDAYSATVAMSGDTVIVGAHGDSDDGGASGSAYLWSFYGQNCPTLFAAPDRISLASGGTQLQSLRAGASHAGELYALYGSASGTSPGLPVGGFTLPLEPDGYFQFLFQNPNALIADSYGVLDANGEAFLQLALPAGLDASLAGVVLNHAYLAVDVSSFPLEVTLASIAQPLELKP